MSVAAMVARIEGNAAMPLADEVDVKLDEEAGSGSLEVILPGVAHSDSIAAAPLLPQPVARVDAEDSCSCDSSDFESLSSAASSASLGSAASSEIPEAILEDSDDGDFGSFPRSNANTLAALGFQPPSRSSPGRRRRLDAAAEFLEDTSSGTPHSPRRPALVSAWTPRAWIAPTSYGGVGGTSTTSSTPRQTRGGDSFPHAGWFAARTSAWMSGSTSLPSVGLASSVAATPRTPVRRARVRGTVRLPTHNTPRRWEDEEVPPLLTPRWDGLGSERSLRARPTTAPPAPGRYGHSDGGWADAEEHNIEVETLHLMAQQVRDAADRQAVLQVIDEDREDLHTRYLEVQGEMAWLRAELCRREAEVLELRQGEDELRRELQRSRSSSSPGTCVVCLDNLAHMASVPCGHLAMCEVCVNHIDRLRCPVCRHPSESFIHIYAS